eukprot:scaffold171517_cov20-Prasinocladus_malaysianus.AAC.1
MAQTPANEKCYCGEVHSKGRPRISPTSELTRLVEVYCSPDLRPHLSQHLQGDERPALDDGTGRKTFWLHVAELFNQVDQPFEPFTDEHTAGDRAQKLDCKLVHFRDAEYLKTQWNNLIKAVTEYFGSWTKSGQQDPSNFWDFCKGDRVSYYAMKRLWGTNLMYATCQVVPAEEAYDAGVETGDPTDAPAHNPASGPQGVKRLNVAKGKGKKKAKPSKTPAKDENNVDNNSSNINVTKLGLMHDKFLHDKKRKDASLAADIFQNANMPSNVTKAAENMLLEFFGCSSATTSAPTGEPSTAQGPEPETSGSSSF